MAACGIETDTKPSRALGAWTLAGAAVFVTTSLIFLGRPANPTDETWMLWVAHRVAGGEALYRDVYFVTTPLAAWVAAAVSIVTGAQLLVLRLLVSACFTAQVLVTLSTAKCCGVGRAGRSVLTIVLLAFAPFLAFTSFYSSLAMLGVLATLRLFLWWQTGRDTPRTDLRALLATGGAAGAAFAAKPNVGLLAILAVGIGILATSREPSLRSIARDVGRVTAGFAAVVAPVIVAILATGAWSSFVGDVFLAKGEYVSTGFSYFDTLGDRVRALLGSSAQTSLFERLRAVPLLTPFVVLPVVVFGVARTTPATRRLGLALAGFVVVALVSVFPRPGVNHFTTSMPFVVAATVAAVVAPAHRVRRRALVVRGIPVGIVSMALVAVLAGGAVLVSADRARATVASGNYDRHSFPHLEGVPVREELRSKVATLRTELHALTNGRVFIMRQDAGFRYFTTGTRDPLPFDMPVLSDFGSEGERGVITRLARGEAPWVCVQSNRPTKRAIDFLRPPELERWVRRHFTLVEHLPGCDLYHRVTTP